MKLVELLARELMYWPKDVVLIMQDNDFDKTIWSLDVEAKDLVYTTEWRSSHTFDIAISKPSRLASDHNTSVVTRAQWQAERDRQNGGEWKRHRGGKQPVADDVRVEVKLRDGDTQEAKACAFLWSHSDCDTYANIMQYRVISQPQAEEAKLSRLEARMLFSEPCIFYPESTEAKTDQIDGPIKWRDTIIHCQAIIEDCEREIERNVQLLDAEGLMMQTDSKKAMQHYAQDVDMSDWRNWKAGDSIECLISRYESLYTVGRSYKVDEVNERHAAVFDDCGGISKCFIDDGDAGDLKFILRP